MKTRRIFLTAVAVVVMVSTGFAAQFYSTGDYTPKTPDDMVYISSGSFEMGASGSYPDELPAHAVTLKAYYLDRHEVSNRQFAAFVAATGHVTQAESDGYAWCYLKGEDDFRAVPGANWRHPQGPGSSIEDRMGHPVVCVSWHDAAAYAAWAGKRLPTEAEWEHAARAGSNNHYAAKISNETSTPDHQTMHHQSGHSQDESPSSKSHSSQIGHASGIAPDNVEYIEANIWQGTWPVLNQLADGFFYTAPPGQFEPNDWGITDMIGNVWEWTADWYAADFYANSPTANPSGPTSGEHRVARGGSWFCSANYCGAYSTHYRGASPPTHTFNNVGFRCAADVPDQLGIVGQE